MLSDESQNTKRYNDTSIDVLPPIKGNLEYVKPLKISQNQYEDPRKYHTYDVQTFFVFISHLFFFSFSNSDLRSKYPHVIHGSRLKGTLLFSAEEFSTATRHHSGHFRHTSAEVWDPHPQYEFTAFGKRFRLRLAHDASFVSPDIKVRIDDDQRRCTDLIVHRSLYPRHILIKMSLSTWTEICECFCVKVGEGCSSMRNAS